MATMKLYELVNHYHIGTELTCAEAMFMACNEYYHLNLSEETRKMFSVMGLGMQTEHSCCGAFTVEELNAHVWGEEFHACIIEKAEFEAIWESRFYSGAF